MTKTSTHLLHLPSVADITLGERSDARELLDAEGHEAADLSANLRDIRRVNRLFGGTAAIMNYLPAMAAKLPHNRTIHILDLATGSADIPLAIAAWARRASRNVHIVASDNSAEILAIARTQVATERSISTELLDARAVSATDQSFDLVLCSLALHHFPPDEARLVLSEMDRLQRHGFILNDLRRSRPGHLATWTAARLTTRNHLTRHDAPLSIRRAYSPTELKGLLHTSGVTGAIVTSLPWFRMVAVKEGVNEPI